MTIALALTGLRQLAAAAAVCGDVEEIHRLLKSGENPNQADENGWTALMFAADNGHSEAVKVLLDNGANAESSRRKRHHGFDIRGCLRPFRNRQSFARQRRRSESSKRRRQDGFDVRGG